MRRERGEFHRLVQELTLYHGRFRTYFRMSCGQFEDLLEQLAPHLKKQRNNFREPIDPEQWLAVCLRFLAVDVGGFGSNSDGGIFANSRFGKALQAGDLNVPLPSPLPSAP
ncbi:hypothetical protein SKAU_G00021540 [Synaphobranchus kaupii]|uniref:Uncharacterized protein n=1 Tax=Synaphobranchus kaupii TaxID=118154 RepID=A0A9Q1GBW1_SYNKA|nr:hypothetical protein SKAU_G00021540 [Synaphobranchus kaupii]